MKKSKIMLTSLAVAMMAISAPAFAEHHEGGEGGPHHGKKGHFFEKADTDGDGKISKAEHMAEAEARFAKMDADGDGFVTKEEIEAKMKKWREMKKDGPKPPPVEENSVE